MASGVRQSPLVGGRRRAGAGRNIRNVTGRRDKKRQLFRLSWKGRLFFLECDSAVSSDTKGGTIGFKITLPFAINYFRCYKALIYAGSYRVHADSSWKFVVNTPFSIGKNLQQLPCGATHFSYSYSRIQKSYDEVNKSMRLWQ